MLKKLCVIAALSLTSLNVMAQELLDTSGDWRVFAIQQDGKKICYLASSPAKSKGSFKKRGDAYFLVTHKSAKQDEVSASSGFPYKEGTDVHVTINGNKKFRLFTQGDLSWARDSTQDNSIVQELKKAGTLMVRGTSKLGTYAEDTYSLKGFSKALEQMKAACK